MGLKLKLVALWIFLAIPLVVLWPAAEWLTVAWYALGVAGIAAAFDVAGRCLCLAAPVTHRTAIGGSVALQLIGLATPLVCALIDLWLIPFGIGIAVCMQAASALMFVWFLESVASEVGRGDLVLLTGVLRRRLAQSLLTGVGFASYFVVVAVVVSISALFTWGYGLVITIPVGILVLLPVGFFTLIIVLAMYRSYGTSLVQLRRAIRDAARRGHVLRSSGALDADLRINGNPFRVEAARPDHDQILR
jgi:hypothetical protein